MYIRVIIVDINVRQFTGFKIIQYQVQIEIVVVFV